MISSTSTKATTLSGSITGLVSSLPPGRPGPVPKVAIPSTDTSSLLNVAGAYRSRIERQLAQLTHALITCRSCHSDLVEVLPPPDRIAFTKRCNQSVAALMPIECFTHPAALSQTVLVRVLDELVD